MIHISLYIYICINEYIYIYTSLYINTYHSYWGIPTCAGKKMIQISLYPSEVRSNPKTVGNFRFRRCAGGESRGVQGRKDQRTMI